jgi:hypothetical protein
MRTIRKVLALYLIVAVFSFSIVSTAGAGLVSSGDIMAQTMPTMPKMNKAAYLNKIQAALETKVVMSRLAELGFTAEEIGSRLAKLSQAQLHTLSQDMDQIRAGGNAIIGALLFVFIVIIILDLTGYTSYIIKK